MSLVLRSVSNFRRSTAMESKTSKAKRPASAKTKVAVVPRIPQEIIDEILDHLTTDSLQSCALVSKSWVPSCRRYLFHTIIFTTKNMNRWAETFPVPAQSPTHYVRDLRFSTSTFTLPRVISKYTPWFTNVEKVSFFGEGMFDIVEPVWTPALPHPVTSLTFGPEMTTTDPVRIQDTKVRLSVSDNADDFLLYGGLARVGRRTLLEVETILGGEFGGELRLFGKHVVGGVVDVVLEIPSGLHFTHLEVRSRHECLLSTVRLAEACSKTLVRLSYRVSFHCKCPAPPLLLLVQKY